jgi:PIN domain nuclease of toxin-antitoxin system
MLISLHLVIPISCGSSGDGVLDVVGTCYRSVTKSALFDFMIYSKLSLDLLSLWSRFWEFWANHLISRLQLNHVPVHEAHSAKVRKITTIPKTPSLTRIVCARSFQMLGPKVQVLKSDSLTV